MVLVQVNSINGDVLMGPVELDASQTVRDVKQQLEAKVLKEAGERKSFRLLLQDRSAELESNLGDLGAESVDFSAVALQSMVGELTMRSREALSRKEERAKRNTTWLEEIGTATDARKRQKREEDLRDYQSALEEMIELMVEEAVFECRRMAAKGQCELHWAFDGSLQRYELGAMLFFRRSSSFWTRDPCMSCLFRGWYFSTHDDEILDPPEVQMGADFGNTMRALRGPLMQHLMQMGLEVEADQQLVSAIKIKWPADDTGGKPWGKCPAQKMA